MVLHGKASLTVCVVLLIAADLAAAADSLFFTESAVDGTAATRIGRLDLQTGQVTTLLAGSGGNVGPLPHNFAPLGIALDRGRGHLYYADVNSDKIGRMNFDGSGRVDVVTGLVDPWDVALDLGAGKIYWTDVFNGFIQRANLDGSNVQTIVSSNSNGIRGIALDIPGGRIYWDDGFRDLIGSAKLDGSDVKLFLSPGGGLGDILVDSINHKLLWSDAFTGNIYRSNTDGSGLEVVVRDGQPWWPVIDEGKQQLYWVDRLTTTIMRSDLNGQNVVNILTSPGLGTGSSLAFLPEPSGMMMIGMAALALKRRSRRSAKAIR